MFLFSGVPRLPSPGRCSLLMRRVARWSRVWAVYLQVILSSRVVPLRLPVPEEEVGSGIAGALSATLDYAWVTKGYSSLFDLVELLVNVHPA